MTGSEFNTYVVNKFVRTDKTTQLYEATTDTILSCGNDAIEPGEECDGSNLNSQTCQTQGY